MTPETLRKAAQLAHGGRVSPDGTASVYEVEGAHAIYRVVLGENFQVCDCRAHDICSHIGAALLIHDARAFAHDLAAVPA